MTPPSPGTPETGEGKAHREEQARPRRLNRYRCQCGNTILSEDVNEGVTPFMLPCGACGGSLNSSFYRVDEADASLPADIEWFKPTTAEVRRLAKSMREHVGLGGLVYRVVSDRPAVHHLRVLQERQWKRR